MSPARLLVADGQPLFRRGLAALLACERDLLLAGEARDALEALQQAHATHPGLVLVDEALPGGGAPLLRALAEAAPAAKIVVLARTAASDPAPSLGSGAFGCVLRTLAPEALFDALRRVLHGETVISPELAGPRGAAVAAPPPPIRVRPVGPSLSPRELEVLHRIAQGASNKEIALALAIAETTVKIHVQHILRKLHVSSRLQAAGAMSSGCVPLPASRRGRPA